MYIINYIFEGGTKWNKEAPSAVYPGKTISGLEHLIVEGGLSLDAGIDLLSYLRSQPIKIYEDLDPKYPDAMIVFHFEVDDSELKDRIVEILENNSSGVGEGFTYQVDVEEKQ